MHSRVVGKERVADILGLFFGYQRDVRSVQEFGERW